MLLGAGARVWNPHALWAGFVAAAAIVPVFYVRHYIQDGGTFPASMEDIATADGTLGERRAGMLPYVALAGGALVVLLASWFFRA
jgi:hypothetical protein